MEIYFRLLDKIRHKFGKVYSGNNKKEVIINCSGIEANKKIGELLRSNNPLMVARFGSGELKTTIHILNIISKPNLFIKSLRYASGKIDKFRWDEKIVKDCCYNMGFFPVNYKSCYRFANLVIESSKNLDILGSWLPNEDRIDSIPKNVIRPFLYNLEPFHFDNPWSKYLKDMNVLVISPFENTIISQYQNYRKKIFKNEDVLPDFNLITLKAIQSIANNETGFNSWFDALEYMKEKIDKIKFDVAIIGCGAYGFPLASFIKESGKKGIHLGGATQLLFGIKGKRWEDPGLGGEYFPYPKLFNEYWVYPDEKPLNYDKIENGCYW